MKLFSKASEYAILAMMRVVEVDSLAGFSPKEICNSTGIPEALGRKALGQLARSHILKGTPGPGGGYQLVPDPSEVSLLDIVVAVDGKGVFDECPLGVACERLIASDDIHACDTCPLPAPFCGFGHMCPMHKIWQQVRTLVVDHLESTTLQDIQKLLGEAHAESTT